MVVTPIGARGDRTATGSEEGCRRAGAIAPSRTIVGGERRCSDRWVRNQFEPGARTRPSGVRPVADEVALRSLTEGELPAEYTELDDDEQWRRENRFYTDLLRHLATVGSTVRLVVDISDRDDERELASGGFVRCGAGKYTGDLTDEAIAALLRTNPNCVVVTAGQAEVAILAGGWDGFHLLVPPARLMIPRGVPPH